MAQGQLDKMMHHVRQLLDAPARGLRDRQLIERFVRQGDQAAFAELVGRHGGMVLAVCRRVLGNVHEAEDAFQATWLVLARKAASMRWSDSIAGFLHAVAHRVACKARGQLARRENHQREYAEMAAGIPRTRPDDPQTSGRPDEEFALLQAELARLPERERAVLVLCYLEGKTNAEAARMLNCPVGSMSKRLARARDLLRRRLSRQGTPVAPAVLTGLLETSGPAVVPETLQQTTIQAAALVATGKTAVAGVATASVTALVEGVLREMSIEKLKLALFVTLTLTVFTVGAGVFGFRGLAGERPAADAATKEAGNTQPNPNPAPAARARTFNSTLPLIVYQMVPNERPRVLGTTGVLNFTGKAAKAVAIPAGAVWYVQPIGFNFVGGLGMIGMPGGGALGAPFVGGVGVIGGNGAGVRGNPGRAPAVKKPAVDFSAGLTGDALKALVAEMKKKDVPGLSVSMMKMGDADLAELANVSGLQTLLVTGTEVSDAGLEKLKDFKALNFLALENTPVAGEGLKHLASAKKLHTLRLSGNKIDNKGMEALREAKSLTSLRLHRTSVDGDGLAALKSLADLHTLELCGGFTDTDLKPIKEMVGLLKLKLCQTSVTDDGIDSLKALKNLESLTIDGHWDCDGLIPLISFAFNANGGRAGGIAGGGAGLLGGGNGALGGVAGGAGAFGGFPGVKIKPVKSGDFQMQWSIPTQTFGPGDRKMVTIDPPQFTSRGLAHLSALPGLVELNVSSEKLTDADMEPLGKLTELKKLGVFAPDVTNKGIAALKDLKKLEMIDLRGTAMTTGCGPTLRGMAPLKRVKSNLISFDPKFKTKMAEWRRLLPRARVEPLFGELGGVFGGFGGVGAFPGNFGGGAGFNGGFGGAGVLGAAGGTPRKT